MKYRFLRFPNGKEKALTLSYDDGSIYDERLIEIANQHGIKVTLNLNSEEGFDNPADEWHMSADKLRGLVASGGHEIAVHGAKHIALGRASIVDGIRDVLVCREGLEKMFGGVIRGMAYADSGITAFSTGVTLPEVKQYLKELGIAYARTLAGDNCRFEVPEDFYEWMPTVHHINPKLMEWLNEFLNAKISDGNDSRTPHLFYLWGHSNEFHIHNNWKVFETFCEKAGGHDEIWYATNIEICDYVNAYRSLQFRVDNTAVFNPTCIDVWFEADYRLVHAPAGKLTIL